MGLSKSELRDRLQALLDLQSQKVNEYTSLRDEADRSLELLMKEIATNKDTPPEIYELAKSFAEKQQIQLIVGSEFHEINQQIACVRNDLYPEM